MKSKGNLNAFPPPRLHVPFGWALFFSTTCPKSSHLNFGSLMHRHANLPQPNSYFDRNQPDNESLLVQLCEHLHRSGFLYNDANPAELRRGEEGLLDFFEQEAQVVQEFLPRERLQQFLEHLQRFN